MGYELYVHSLLALVGVVTKCLSLSLSPEESGQVDAKKVTKENYSHTYLFFQGAHECLAFQERMISNPESIGTFISVY